MAGLRTLCIFPKEAMQASHRCYGPESVGPSTLSNSSGFFNVCYIPQSSRTIHTLYPSLILMQTKFLAPTPSSASNRGPRQLWSKSDRFWIIPMIVLSLRAEQVFRRYLIALNIELGIEEVRKFVERSWTSDGRVYGTNACDYK